MSDVKPLEVLVATIYADHAADGRTAWVTLDRLRERSKLSRDAAHRALKGLVAKGLLVVVQKAKQHRATVYALVIPDDLSSTGDGPLVQSSSTSPGPLSQSSSTSRDTSRTGGLSNQIAYPIPDPISLSRDQELVADLLGLEPRDERLKNVQKMLTDNNVRSPRAWITTVARDETLLGLLDAARPAPNPDAWMTARSDRHFCGECFQPMENHSSYCSQSDKQPLLCASGCGQIVKLADLTLERPCKVCGQVNTLTQKDAS